MTEKESIFSRTIYGEEYDQIRKEGKDEGYANGYEDGFQEGYRSAKHGMKVKVECPHCKYDLEYDFIKTGIKEVVCPNPRCGKSFSVILSVEAIDFSKPLDKES